MVLTLKNDSLLRIPESIANLSKLETLDLGGNRISELPVSIVNLKNLEELYLDHDNRLDFRNAFILLGKLPRLRVLHLEGNELTSLPETINNLQALEKLYLNQNELSLVDIKRDQLKRLLLVDLQQNQVPVGTLDHLERTGVRIRF